MLMCLIGMDPIKFSNLALLDAGAYSAAESSEVGEIREQLGESFKTHSQGFSKLLDFDSNW
jgi:hypothetical protein